MEIVGNNVVFTLKDGTTFSIPLYTGIKLNFGTQSSISLVYGDTETVNFTAEGSDSFTPDNLFLIAPSGWEASIAAQTRALPSTAFTLTVTAPADAESGAASGEILVLLDNGQGNTTIGRIKVATKTTLNGTELTAVNLQAGELAKAIGSHADLTSITVTSGTLNSADWTAIQQNNNSLKTLDLEGANYTGEDKSYLEYVFLGNDLPLKEVKLPKGVTGLGGLAFRGCSDLASITLPDELTSIGTNVFYECSALTSINLPDELTSIGISAFYGCSSLTSITLPEGLQSIKATTFYGCSSLTSITLPEGLQSIEVQAFYGCSDLASITCLATTPPALEVNAFYGCNALTAIYVPAGSVETYKSNWSQYADKIKEISEGI